MTRYDAVNYISHGLAKRPGAAQPRPVRGANEGEDGERVVKRARKRWRPIASNLNKKAKEGKIDPLIGREAEVLRSIQILCRRQKNNPLLVGDPGVGKTAIAEGLARKINEKQVPGSSGRRHHLLARHGRAARRHALSRRFRRALEERDEGAGEPPQGDLVHRRDPHRDRRRRHQRRGDGRLEPAEARAANRASCAAWARPRTRNIASISRRTARWRGASRRSTSTSPSIPDAIKILMGLQALFRGISQGEIHRRSHQGGGGAFARATSATASCRTKPST